jgi:hypothetical protein
MRMPIRFAHRHASLRMTERLSVPQWLKPRCPGALYAALKRRSSTVLHASLVSAIKIKIKVKGVGQSLP